MNTSLKLSDDSTISIDNIASILVTYVNDEGVQVKLTYEGASEVTKTLGDDEAIFLVGLAKAANPSA